MSGGTPCCRCGATRGPIHACSLCTKFFCWRCYWEHAPADEIGCTGQKGERA